MAAEQLNDAAYICGYLLFLLCRLVLLLGLSSTTAVGATVVQDVLALLGGLQLLQLGSLSLLVYIATVWLEDGLLATLKNIFSQLVAGSFLFYVFRGQTTAHYFVSDVKYGGAKYAATGRGYKLQATPFMDLFQLYARCVCWSCPVADGARMILFGAGAHSRSQKQGYCSPKLTLCSRRSMSTYPELKHVTLHRLESTGT